MSRREPLDILVRDASDELRGQLVKAGRRRDFAAMVARARTLDPSAVSAEDAAEASTFAPVVVLHGRSPEVDRDPVDAAPSAPSQRMSRGMVGLAVGLAAVLLLSLAGAGPLARRQVAALRGEAASHHLAPSPRFDRAVLRDDGQTTSPADGGRADDRLQLPEDSSGDDPLETEALDVLTPDELTPDELTPATEIDDPAPTTGRSPPTRPAESNPASPSSAPSELRQRPFDTLDRSARQAWRSGDLRKASALFETIITVESDPKRVELAFGDLLIVTRQLGDHPALTRIRHDYLRRSPTGVYAEDVRAALCQDNGERECWRVYMASWPSGAHADEARRALAEQREQKPKKTDALR